MQESFINYLLKAVILPPGSIVVLIIIGLLIYRKNRTIGISLITVTTLSTWIISMPVVSDSLITMIQTFPALTEEQINTEKADAIVVLGAGRYSDAPEYGGDTVSDLGLVRIRYAVYLHKKTGLPIIVTGGTLFATGKTSEAQLMKQSLQEDFGIQNVLTEDESHNTAENALFTRTLLEQHDMKHVYLVTHAWHMPRSVEIFTRSGIDVIPAPTGFEGTENTKTTILGWLPSSMHETRWALHELIGRLWYRFRY